ncbi:hypothetical protein BD414DRAFT_489670 [Trametes punicea]|nr:hypothetical protein BD414DRAFT_489670 [Trametes punicea]
MITAIGTLERLGWMPAVAHGIAELAPSGASNLSVYLASACWCTRKIDSLGTNTRPDRPRSLDP